MYFPKKVNGMKTMKEYISTAEGMNQMWGRINETLDGFDFGKVVLVMKTLDWTWACTKDEAEYYESCGCEVRNNGAAGHGFFPEYQQALATAREEIYEAITSMPDNETYWSVECGGFFVSISISTDKEREEYYDGEAPDDFKHSVGINLRFCVESSGTY